MASAYPPIADYGLIADCHGAALVSREGSIDWCCIPRFDSGACFARLLDWEKGGHCSIEPTGREAAPPSREYLEGTLVLVTTLHSELGEARVIDFMPLGGDQRSPRREIGRILEGVRGVFEFTLRIVPRFDCGEVDPWIRRHGANLFSAIGGDDGLVVSSDAPLSQPEQHSLEAAGTLRADERIRFSLSSVAPAELEEDRAGGAEGIAGLDDRLNETIQRWREWASRIEFEGTDHASVERSALVLKSLTYEPTGAMAAAPTTSLPEGRGCSGERNWDYRFAWIRDSGLAVRSLARLGCEAEADAFRRFAERSAAGNAHDLQVFFGLGGERRPGFKEADHLEGYRKASPVRIGNDAVAEVQFDVFGQLLDQAWQWYARGHEPDDDYWRFLADLVEHVVEYWQDPDCGIWEWRGDPKHFVHSKVLCWCAVDRGLELAERCMRKAPERRWKRAREDIREAIESKGYDRSRGVFVQAFGSRDLDSALLRLPTVGFVAYDDERMVRTVDAIREELDLDGLLRRYANDDGLQTEEGAFLPCTYWLVGCLAGQGRVSEAREVYDRVSSTANDLGLMSEEYDPEVPEMLGNFPQALTHLSHLEAAMALTRAERGESPATAERAV